MSKKEKTVYDVVITDELLRKDEKDLSELEKVAVKSHRERIESYSKQLEYENERIRQDCRILCSGKYYEHMVIPEYGWIEPVKKLAYALEKLNLFYKKWHIRVKISQTKEKYGTFRCYYDIIEDSSSFIGRTVDKLLEWLNTSFDYGMTTIVDKEEYASREWEECSKKEFDKHLDRLGKAMKAKDFEMYELDSSTSITSKSHVYVGVKPPTTIYFLHSDGKYYRSYILWHGRKTHTEITKHKWLKKFSNWLSNIRYKCSFTKKMKPELVVMYENFFNEVNELIAKCEKECYDRCQDCGAFICENGHQDRCETHGWVTYVCKGCAVARGGIFYNQKSKKWYNGLKLAQNPYSKFKKK